MTDAELDRDWVPNGRRPLSTVARSFSQELVDIFRIDNSVSDLDLKVKQRRENVGKTTQELADLEARLREMEERLHRNKRAPQPARRSQAPPGLPPPPPPAKDESNKSRPGTARASQQAPGSGNMPPTPGPSEDGDADQ